MREFINIVKESPVARKGDWSGASTIIGELSTFVMEKSWTKMGEMTTDDGVMAIIRHESGDAYRLGHLQPTSIPSKDDANRDKLVFATVFSIRMSATRSHGFKDKGVMILGDREQYFGARRLWAALSRDTDIIVDVVDYRNLTVIARDVRLHQGRYDEDFDKAIWSYDDSRKHIRLVLRDVI